MRSSRGEDLMEKVKLAGWAIWALEFEPCRNCCGNPLNIICLRVKLPTRELTGGTKIQTT